MKNAGMVTLLLLLHDFLLNAVWRIFFSLVGLSSAKHSSNMRRCGQTEFLARTEETSRTATEGGI
jgi:hypothetical protein